MKASPQHRTHSFTRTERLIRVRMWGSDCVEYISPDFINHLAYRWAHFNTILFFALIRRLPCAKIFQESA